MLSRVADSLYWLSRYTERAENVARFVDVNLQLMLDLPNHATTAGDEWLPLVITTGDLESFNERYGEPTREKVIQFLAFDADNPNSIISCVRAARENARSIREVISSEMWEALNGFYLMVRGATASGVSPENPNRLLSFFTDVKHASFLLHGATDTTLSHGEGWHFWRMGLMIERADKTSRILDVKYFMLSPKHEHGALAFESIQWASLLKSASALEMYRKRHRRVTPAQVAEFLILDSDFPRAIRHCVEVMEDSLRAITGAPHGQHELEAERRLGRLSGELRFLTVEEILEAGLHEWLDGMQTRLNHVGEGLFNAFFAMGPDRR